MKKNCFQSGMELNYFFVSACHVFPMSTFPTLTDVFHSDIIHLLTVNHFLSSVLCKTLWEWNRVMLLFFLCFSWKNSSNEAQFGGFEIPHSYCACSNQTKLFPFLLGAPRSSCRNRRKLSVNNTSIKNCDNGRDCF